MQKCCNQIQLRYWIITSNNFYENEKMRLTVAAAYPIFGLMPPSSNRKRRLFWNIYQCPYGFSWFANYTLSFLDTPTENVTGHSMSTNNFLVDLPDFTQTLPTYSGSWIWKVLLFSSSKLNWLRKQVKVRGLCTKFSDGRLVSDKV